MKPNEPNGLNTPSEESKLLNSELPEDRYRVDFQLSKQGQSLAKELLQLSIAGIAVIGFLLSLLTKCPQPNYLSDCLLKLLVSLSVAGFAAAICSALLQRFYAAGAMFHHIKGLKKSWLKEPEKAIEEEIKIRKMKFDCAHFFLKATAISLSLGAIFLGGAFIRLMFIF